MRRSVRFIKEIPEMGLVGRRVGPFSADDEAELWLWDSIALERQGMAVPVKKPTPVELRKLILAEERSSDLTPLAEDFYSSVAHEISAMRAAGEPDKAGGLNDQAVSLMETRLPKLVRLALSPDSPSGLPLEEHLLVNRLAELFEDWSKRLSGSLEKSGEEVGRNELGGAVQRVAGDKADIQKQRVPAP